jgi:hypothetical protein
VQSHFPTRPPQKESLLALNKSPFARTFARTRGYVRNVAIALDVAPSTKASPTDSSTVGFFPRRTARA